jgi:ketosteroid isomerase-like protein
MIIFTFLTLQKINIMDNVSIVKQAYQAFAEGNVPAVLALFDPQIKWMECKSFPIGPDDGLSIGPDAVVADVFSHIPVIYDGFNIEIIDIFSSGDKVAMYGYYKGIYKETGKSFKAQAAHIWTVKNGKLASFFQAVDTFEIMTA